MKTTILLATLVFLLAIPAVGQQPSTPPTPTPAPVPGPPTPALPPLPPPICDKCASAPPERIFPGELYLFDLGAPRSKETYFGEALVKRNGRITDILIDATAGARTRPLHLYLVNPTTGAVDATYPLRATNGKIAKQFQTTLDQFTIVVSSTPNLQRVTSTTSVELTTAPPQP